ncbi:DUF481 domain-containing protein [Algivirga pacifica]|uniref:DUF481 domain-containing protein n=1 Tax=Algivirga pacifica TaxID=1162670 RepID=A0ABP9DL17_9BACT
MNFFRTHFLFLLLSLPCISIAQQDSIRLDNGNTLTGEIKSLNQGVFKIETDYSKDDFKIKWKEVTYVHTNSQFAITLSDGSRLTGPLIGYSDNDSVMIIKGEDQTLTRLQDIVYLKSVSEGFWDRAYASLDFGYNYTRAQSLQQMSLGSTMGYISTRWWVDIKGSLILTLQEEADDIRRMNSNIGFRYLLSKGWYVVTDLSFLSNTEQSLELRSLAKAGIGVYLIQSNRTYWGVESGLAFNNENFEEENEQDLQSAEAFLGTEFNLFDVGDWSLLTNVIVYRSLTEDNRWRIDQGFNSNIKLPLNFYISVGFNINYDSRPVASGSDLDYILRTSFGWKL